MKKHIRKSRARGIAETYIHIKYDDAINKKPLDEIQLYLESNVREWTRNFYKKPVEISITVEEGSIKAWLKVGGALYFMIAGYGSFRTGIDYLVKDGKNFSDYAIEQFYQHEHIPEGDIIRDERRLGIPGKIQRFLRECDKLSNQGNAEREQFIQDLTDESLEIIILLEDDMDRNLFIDNIPNEVSERLPDQLPEPIGGTMHFVNERREEDRYLVNQRI